uniref:Putative capsid protein n=1 Tax=viral metagenome TaxID=1070528 RepID=A0A6M3INJ3_9ZZZZ
MALTYSELDAHVREKYIPVLQDAYYYSTPLMAQLMAKSKVVFDSGAKIDIPVLYGELPSGWYTGLDTFDISKVETTTLAKFAWKQMYVDVTLDGTTELQVEGDEKVLSIIETKMENALKTFSKQFSQAIYADQGTKAIRPMTEALATTGTYGEISKTTYSWWRGQVNSTGGAYDHDMAQSMYGDCSDGATQPDLIITTQDIFDKIWLRVQPLQRGNLENTPGLAKVGYTGIAFNKATIVVDNYCPSGYIFFLNTNFWKLVVHKKRNMHWTDSKVPLNQDAWVRQLLWAGALCCAAPRWNGYISSVS